MRRYQNIIFHLERFILRGARHQLLLIAGLLCLVSLLAGGILFLANPEDKNFLEWAWWGFLRLSDPGYLGDDEGMLRRTVSTVVTVLGYVLFMGALVAIMTQGLYRTISRLEAGLTPITENGHIIILGWTNRTASIVREILLAGGRVKRFLRRVGTGNLNIVILVDEVSTSLVFDLKDELGAIWDEKKVILRSGNPLRLEHLLRVDFLNAAAVIVPATSTSVERSDTFDARMMKTLLIISNTAQAQIPHRKPPLLVAEIFDPRKADLARKSYHGNIEIVPSSSIISRLIAQNVRHAGLSHVYRELLTHGSGNEIYIREYPELSGVTFGTLAGRFPKAIPLGVLRQEDGGLKTILNPQPGFRLGNERIVFMARRYDETEPSKERSEDAEAGTFLAPIQDAKRQRKVLILGWGSKLPVLLSEFDSYEKERFSLDIMSIVSIDEREKYLRRFGHIPKHVSIRHIDGDYTSPFGLQSIRLSEYNNIVFLASDWMESESESDARTILGYQLLRSHLDNIPALNRPRVLIELMDPENEPLFHARSGEVLVSPVIISHMLGHVALRAELRIVFEELFTAGGAEIFFHQPRDYFSTIERPVTFRHLQETVAAHGNIALGLFRPETDNAKEMPGQLFLNPPRDMTWHIQENDEIVVLTIYF